MFHGDVGKDRTFIYEESRYEMTPDKILYERSTVSSFKLSNQRKLYKRGRPAGESGWVVTSA